MKKPHISVVSPVYGCVQALPELCARLHAELSKITNNYEVILVNDASPDASWDVICQYAEIDKETINQVLEEAGKFCSEIYAFWQTK